jgi:REP element-mobilizing transposase RayT
VVLSHAGRIAWRCWNEIPAHHPHVLLDEFIVTPDHLHGVLILTDRGNRESQNRRFGSVQKGSLGHIIQTYKAAATRLICMEGLAFAWQPNYYDHVIRDDQDLDRIRRYIRNHPRLHTQS